MRVPVIACLLAALSLVFSLPASAQAPKPEAKPAAKPGAKPAQKPAAKPAEKPAAKPANEAAQKQPPAEAGKANAAIRDVYAAMPMAERLSIQSDLIWSGDYNGGVTGEFGDRAIAAVKAFQKKQKGKETGILTPEERAALSTAVKSQREQVGWKIVEDPVMPGVFLGIPGKLATVASRGKSGGRWASSRGEVQIETFRESAADTALSVLFEQQKKNPTGRKTEYSVLRSDFYVVSGLQGLKKFYVRAQLKDNDVRGVTILYDQAMDGIMEPVVVAMSSAFAPFGGGNAMPGLKRRVEYATAIVASASGHLIADRMATDGCHVIVVPGVGNAERIAQDQASELALLRVYGVGHLKPMALSAQPPRSAELTLVGIGDPQNQDGRSNVSTFNVKIRGTENGLVALDPAPPSGFSGAAVIDAQGQFVGLAGLKAASTASLVSAAAIRKFLEDAKIAPASGGTSIDAAKASVTRVICVRK
ncbi:MAG: peptidoglycan-binding protein [Pseudorhodoplanes sp.]|nr:peptidoglycan-binding protein [Pseudorhodoplanes sp.]